MLPTAGLFLPDTLHRSPEVAANPTEPVGARLKYFQRKTGKSKQAPRQPAYPDLAMAERDSLEDTATVFPSLAIAFDYADFVSSSSKASAEAGSFAILVHRLRQDINEASRLYLSPAVKNFLEDWPDRKSWIDAIIFDVRRALNDIGNYVDIVRTIGDDGGASGMRRRFEWAMGHHKKLSPKQQLLTTCHQSLMTAIHIMQTVELCGVSGARWEDPIYEAPIQPWAKNKGVIRGPYSPREFSVSQKSLSASSVQLKRPGSGSLDSGSIRSMPAELPGSTPDDLNRPQDRISDNSPTVYKPYRQSVASLGTQSSHNVSSNTPLKGAFQPDTPAFEPEPSRIIAPKSESSSGSVHLTTVRKKTSNRTRTSLDDPQHRPGRERLLSAPAVGTKTSASMDIVRLLPTLVEKTVERNDSTASTVNLVEVSHVAKRYHASSVYIRNRHHSLPAELPHVLSHSSLTEDLADWILPSANSDKFKSTEWEDYSVSTSPLVSVTSCPAIDDAATSESMTDTSPPGETPDESTRDVELRTEEASDSMQKRRSTWCDKELWLDVGHLHAHSSSAGASTNENNGGVPVDTSSKNQERRIAMGRTLSSIIRKPLPAGAVVPVNLNSTEPSKAVEVTPSIVGSEDPSVAKLSPEEPHTRSTPVAAVEEFISSSTPSIAPEHTSVAEPSPADLHMQLTPVPTVEKVVSSSTPSITIEDPSNAISSPEEPHMQPTLIPTVEKGVSSSTLATSSLDEPCTQSTLILTVEAGISSIAATSAASTPIRESPSRPVAATALLTALDAELSQRQQNILRIIYDVGQDAPFDHDEPASPVEEPVASDSVSTVADSDFVTADVEVVPSDNKPEILAAALFNAKETEEKWAGEQLVQVELEQKTDQEQAQTTNEQPEQILNGQLDRPINSQEPQIFGDYITEPSPISQAQQDQQSQLNTTPVTHAPVTEQAPQLPPRLQQPQSLHSRSPSNTSSYGWRVGDEIPKVPQTVVVTVSAKPLSAQAKRRAAHQRRMEIAFGGGGT